MIDSVTDRRPLYQTIAIVASCAGLLCACGLGPRQSAPVPPTPPYITVSLSSTHIVFPATAVGTESAPQSLTITNADASPVSFAVAMSSRSPQQVFLRANSCGAVLQPEESCTVSLAYKPSSAGPFRTSLSLSDPKHATMWIPIEGAGAAASPEP